VVLSLLLTAGLGSQDVLDPLPGLIVDQMFMLPDVLDAVEDDDSLVAELCHVFHEHLLPEWFAFRHALAAQLRDVGLHGRVQRRRDSIQLE
jgi:hypothetical protein